VEVSGRAIPPWGTTQTDTIFGIHLIGKKHELFLIPDAFSMPKYDGNLTRHLCRTCLNETDFE